MTAPLWPGGAQGSRNAYVQGRVALRMMARGEPMILRRVSLLPGPVPYTYPPDVSLDMTVSTGVIATDGNPYFGLIASSINGRLQAGDQINTGGFTWSVLTMPRTILTDSDGIAEADSMGNPLFGSPTIYNNTILAANNEFRVVPVFAEGNPNPAACIGLSVTLTFASDVTVFGRVLSLREMAVRNWTQTNTLGLNIAALSDTGEQIYVPDIDDLIIVNGETRAVMAVGPVFRNGVYFLFDLQCR
jgi:hypothetical protein